jgi:4-amino-4-deoxy-L-arabinose transferase-like glycosyltransferase
LRDGNWAASAPIEVEWRGASFASLNPPTLVALMATCQVAAWTLAPALSHNSLPLDVVEGYMWGREWVIATYKHPALPSWVLETSRIATGAIGWPAYLVSQLFIAATFLFVYLLGRDLLGPRRAAAGTLLLTGIAFYAWPTVEFNHNVAQMPFWAALPWALWRAVERKSPAWWALVGALAAGSVYAKLTSVLLLVALLGWTLWDRDARRCLTTPGPWIGLALFMVLAAPLAQWLVANDFAPLQYAASRARMSRGSLQVFIFSLVLSLCGLAILLAIAGLIGRRSYVHPTDALAPPWSRSPPVPARTIRFLGLITTAPLILTMIGAGLSGSSVKVAWSSSFFNYAGILAIALTSPRFSEKALRRIAVSAGVLLIGVPLGYSLITVARQWQPGGPLRVDWPQADISQRFVELWMHETGQPLRIVAGNHWIAGLVGVTAAAKPSLFSRADHAAAPWITPARLEREGMLVVWEASNMKMPQGLLPLAETAPVREETFISKRSAGGGEVVIRYVIVPPKRGQ